VLLCFGRRFGIMLSTLMRSIQLCHAVSVVRSFIFTKNNFDEPSPNIRALGEPSGMPSHSQSVGRNQTSSSRASPINTASLLIHFDCSHVFLVALH